MKLYRLILAHHSVDEWIAIRADQARGLGCSDAYIKRLVQDLIARSEAPPLQKARFALR
jgi:hypothetical protein